MCQLCPVQLVLFGCVSPQGTASFCLRTHEHTPFFVPAIRFACVLACFWWGRVGELAASVCLLFEVNAQL